MRAWIWRPTSRAGHTRGAWRERHHRLLAIGLWTLGAWPALRLLVGWRHGTLGADPLAIMIHTTGWWALAWLFITLAVTPLRRASRFLARRVHLRVGRRLSDWNGLIRHRRQMGLWAFAYASAHLGLYLELDAGGLEAAWQDLQERPFIALGLLAWLMMVPLAATSNQPAMRRLKKRWAALHRLVYPTVALAVTHDVWQTHPGHPWPWASITLCVLLLAARAASWWQGDRADATEHPRGSRADRHTRH